MWILKQKGIQKFKILLCLPDMFSNRNNAYKYLEIRNKKNCIRRCRMYTQQAEVWPENVYSTGTVSYRWFTKWPNFKEQILMKRSSQKQMSMDWSCKQVSLHWRLVLEVHTLGRNNMHKAFGLRRQMQLMLSPRTGTIYLLSLLLP